MLHLPVFALYLLPYGSPVSDKGCNQSINQTSYLGSHPSHTSHTLDHVDLPSWGLVREKFLSEVQS